MSRLREQLNEAVSRSSDLRERLSPILAPQPPRGVDRAGEPKPVGRTPLLTEIAELSTLTTTVLEVLSDTQERVELF